MANKWPREYDRPYNPPYMTYQSRVDQNRDTYQPPPSSSDHQNLRHQVPSGGQDYNIQTQYNQYPYTQTEGDFDSTDTTSSNISIAPEAVSNRKVIPPTTLKTTVHPLIKDYPKFDEKPVDHDLDGKKCLDCKIGIFGVPNVGKSSIVHRYIYGEESTVDVSRRNTKCQMEEKVIKNIRPDEHEYLRLNIWDTGYSQKLQSMVCDKCEVAIVVFDLNNLDTLTEANNIIDLIKKKVDGYPTQFLLAGNKCDDGDYNKKKILDEAKGLERVVDIPLHEISAKTGTGIAELFDAAKKCKKQEEFKKKEDEEAHIKSELKKAQSEEVRIKSELKEKERHFEDQQRQFEQQKKELQVQLEVKNVECEKQKDADFNRQKQKLAELEAKMIELENKKKGCILS
ncbi:uncharacterized protein [Dysidea avara]|uniref:uncharacterized protein isoform X2 n=1 Tax=Dysidea avara TaxID=196820 RepID=UPI00332DBB4B